MSKTNPKASNDIFRNIERQAKTTLFGRGKSFHELSNEWSDYTAALVREKLRYKISPEINQPKEKNSD